MEADAGRLALAAYAQGQASGHGQGVQQGQIVQGPVQGVHEHEQGQSRALQLGAWSREQQTHDAGEPITQRPVKAQEVTMSMRANLEGRNALQYNIKYYIFLQSLLGYDRIEIDFILGKHFFHTCFAFDMILI